VEPRTVEARGMASFVEYLSKTATFGLVAGSLTPRTHRCSTGDGRNAAHQETKSERTARNDFGKT